MNNSSKERKEKFVRGNARRPKVLSNLTALGALWSRWHYLRASSEIMPAFSNLKSFLRLKLTTNNTKGGHFSSSVMATHEEDWTRERKIGKARPLHCFSLRWAPDWRTATATARATQIDKRRSRFMLLFVVTGAPLTLKRIQGFLLAVARWAATGRHRLIIEFLLLVSVPPSKRQHNWLEGSSSVIGSAHCSLL